MDGHVHINPGFLVISVQELQEFILSQLAQAGLQANIIKIKSI